MKVIKTIKPFPVSLDEGLTTTTIPAGVHEVEDWVANVAIEIYGAEELKGAEAKKELVEQKKAKDDK